MLSAPEAFRPTQMLDVRLRLLQSSPMSIEPRTRVRLHLGTREIMARVALPERKPLEPGEESVVQLRREAPLVAAWGDRFVLRRYSPALTIGGGTVLDPHPAKHRRFDADLLDHLRVLECGELRKVVERWILAVADRLKIERDLLGELGIGPERLQEVLGELVAAGMVVRVDSEGRAQLLHSSVRGRWGERIEVALADFHRSEPLKPGLRREELRNLSARYVQPELFDCVLRHLVDEGRVAMDGAVVRAASHGIRFTPEEEAVTILAPINSLALLTKISREAILEGV